MTPNKKRVGSKTQLKQVMHNTIAQPIPEQQLTPPGQLPTVNILAMTFCDMEYPFGQSGSAVLAVLSPSFFCSFSLTKHGKLQSP